MANEQQKNKRVVAVMAHPDDAEILTGGTLLLLQQSGWEIGIISMTRGDCGSATHTKQAIARIRYNEAKTAAATLGAWYESANLMDVEIFYNAENLRRVVELMRCFKPDVVITHAPVDYMLDHEETSKLARAAAFAVAMPLYETGADDPAPPAQGTPALYYADPVEGKDHFGKRVPPQFYIDIGAQLERKRELLACHQSQRQWLADHHGIDEYLDRMTMWAALYGQECGVAYAEGFRQFLGHGYPQDALLQTALAGLLRFRSNNSE